MNLFSKKNIKQGYEDSKMKIDLEESDTKMYIVLDKDSKTYDGFQFKFGQWNEKLDNVGLHVYKNKPYYFCIPYIPNNTYLVEEVEGLLRENFNEAQYKRVKIPLQPLSLYDLLGEDKKGFSKEHLHNADFSEANLSKADLSGADLRNANLSKANLLEANLSKANLLGADLSGAKLYGACFLGAHEVKNNPYLSIKQQTEAHC